MLTTLCITNKSLLWHPKKQKLNLNHVLAKDPNSKLKSHLLSNTCWRQTSLVIEPQVKNVFTRVVFKRQGWRFASNRKLWNIKGCHLSIIVKQSRQDFCRIRGLSTIWVKRLHLYGQGKVHNLNKLETWRHLNNTKKYLTRHLNVYCPKIAAVLSKKCSNLFWWIWEALKSRKK